MGWKFTKWADPHSHYDVEINPVVRDTNQKRPRSMLRAVWEQLILEQTSQEWKKAFDVCAFDGRKNCFTPILFPIEEGELTQTGLPTPLTIHRPVTYLDHHAGL